MATTIILRGFVVIKQSDWVQLWKEIEYQLNWEIYLDFSIKIHNELGDILFTRQLHRRLKLNNEIS